MPQGKQPHSGQARRQRRLFALFDERLADGKQPGGACPRAQELVNPTR